VSLAGHPAVRPADPPSGQPYLRLRDVVKTFDGVKAVAGVSLDIERGEIFALLGPSGCGKTTLLRMLAGFETPSSGSILLDGEDLSAQPPYLRPINMMFQSYALFPHLTVRENIAFGLKRAGLPRAEIESQVEAMLSLVQLGALAGRKPHQLSGGQQQRVALARSLARQPRLLLLDEPLGALDRKLREDTQLELVRILRQVGVTCVLVTHDQEEAMTMASRIAVMHDGRLQQVGTPAELYDAPTSRFVADFIGNVNLIEAMISEGHADHALLDSADLRHHVAHGIGATVGTKLTLALRPERIHLSPQPPEDLFNRVEGRISGRSYFGSHTHYQLELPSGQRLLTSLASQRGSEAHAVGDRVWAHWSRTAAIVLTV
jgi:putrescine transport system ATP-binding protein